MNTLFHFKMDVKQYLKICKIICNLLKKKEIRQRTCDKDNGNSIRWSNWVYYFSKILTFLFIWPFEIHLNFVD